jgi:hypothetical protein
MSPEDTMLTVEQAEVVNDSDAVCGACGANPREADALDGWFIDSVLIPDDGLEGVRVAQVRCPQCW